jgi:hypothetical protein
MNKASAADPLIPIATQVPQVAHKGAWGAGVQALFSAVSPAFLSGGVKRQCGDRIMC